MDSKTACDKLGVMIACSLVVAVDDMLADGEPETFGLTMGDAQ